MFVSGILMTDSNHKHIGKIILKIFNLDNLTNQLQISLTMFGNFFLLVILLAS